MASEYQEEWEQQRMEAISDLAENMIYRIPGCDSVTVRKTLQAVYAEFCRESTCLRSHLRIPMKKDIAVYPIPALYGGYVDSVQGVVISPFEQNYGLDYTVDDGVPVCVRLVHPPSDMAKNLTLEVFTIEMPMPNTETAPRGIIGRYGQFIVNGVMERLLSMNGRMWYDAAAAQYEHKKYVDGIGSVRQKMLSGGQAGSGRVSAMNYDNVII